MKSPKLKEMNEPSDVFCAVWQQCKITSYDDLLPIRLPDNIPLPPLNTMAVYTVAVLKCAEYYFPEYDTFHELCRRIRDLVNDFSTENPQGCYEMTESLIWKLVWIIEREVDDGYYWSFINELEWYESRCLRVCEDFIVDVEASIREDDIPIDDVEIEDEEIAVGGGDEGEIP